MARLGDGWMSTTLTPELLGEYLGDIRRYADEVGRELPDDFDVVAFHSVMIDDDRDAAFAEQNASSTTTTSSTTPKPHGATLVLIRSA